MKIGFEAKRFFTNYTGLGNYSRFVIDALSQAHPENQHILFSPKVVDHVENREILKRQNVQVVAPKGLYSKPLFSAIWRTWGVSRSSSAQKLDIFHGLSQELPLGLSSATKKVVTVHDLIFLRYPEFYNSVDVSIYTRKVRMACERADCVIAISHQTADDIRNYLKIDGAKIHVVYQGNHPVFNAKCSDDQLRIVREKYQLPDKFILNVGTVEERKNLLLIIKALALLPKASRIPLIVVGRKTPYYDRVLAEVKKQNLENEIRFLQAVVFQDLPAIYQQARLFIYPSLFEGFGIPLIEAITSGVPVVTSTGSCFQEAAGEGAVYVDPNDAESLANELKVLLFDDEKRKLLKSNGRKHIEQFQPKVIAEHLHKVYSALVSDHRLNTAKQT